MKERKGRILNIKFPVWYPIRKETKEKEKKTISEIKSFNKALPPNVNEHNSFDFGKVVFSGNITEDFQRSYLRKLTDHLLQTSTKYFTDIIQFILHKKDLWDKMGSERLGSLCKSAQLVSGRGQDLNSSQLSLKRHSFQDAKQTPTAEEGSAGNTLGLASTKQGNSLGGERDAISL